MKKEKYIYKFTPDEVGPVTVIVNAKTGVPKYMERKKRCKKR